MQACKLMHLNIDACGGDNKESFVLPKQEQCHLRLYGMSEMSMMQDTTSHPDQSLGKNC